MASELDFDRSLPPIMPDRGAWFNDQVAALVEQAAGDEEFLKTARVELPAEERYFGVPMIEYPSAAEPKPNIGELYAARKQRSRFLSSKAPVRIPTDPRSEITTRLISAVRLASERGLHG